MFEIIGQDVSPTSAIVRYGIHPFYIREPEDVDRAVNLLKRSNELALKQKKNRFAYRR